jgi:hypothetical protein
VETFLTFDIMDIRHPTSSPISMLRVEQINNNRLTQRLARYITRFCVDKSNSGVYSFDILLFRFAFIAVLWALRFTRAAVGSRPFPSSSILSPRFSRRLLSSSSQSQRMATSINVAGFSSCGDFQRARAAAQGLGAICPDKFSVSIREFPDREQYDAWLAEAREVGTS